MDSIRLARRPDSAPYLRALKRLYDAEAHLVILENPDDPKAASEDGWTREPAAWSDVEASVFRGRWVGLVPESLSLLCVDVDRDKTFENHQQSLVCVPNRTAKAKAHLGEPLSECASGSGARHLFYSRRAELPFNKVFGPDGKPWMDLIHGPGQQVVLYDPAAVVRAVSASGAAHEADVEGLPVALGGSNRRSRKAQGAAADTDPTDGTRPVRTETHGRFTCEDLSPEALATTPEGSRHTQLFESIVNLGWCVEAGQERDGWIAAYKDAAAACGLPEREVGQVIADALASNRVERGAERRADGFVTPFNGGHTSAPTGDPGPQAKVTPVPRRIRPPDPKRNAEWEVALRDPLVIEGEVHAWTRARLRTLAGRTVVDREVFGRVGLSGERDLQAVWDSYADPEEFLFDRTDRNRKFARAVEGATKACHAVTRCDLSVDPHDEADDFLSVLGTSLPRTGWFAAFGARKGGKSWVTRYLALEVARAGLRVVWVDCEDGAVGDNYARMAVAGLPADERNEVAGRILRLTTTHLNTAAGMQALAEAMTGFGADYLIFDSATAACSGELNAASAASAFYERLNALPVAGGLVINHTAKSNFGKDGEDGATALGSTVWESIPRGMAVVRPLDPKDWRPPKDAEEQEGGVDPFDVDGGFASWVVEFKVSGSNGMAREGEGCQLRVSKGGNRVTFETARLRPETRQQRQEAVRQYERSAIERQFGMGIHNTTEARAVVALAVGGARGTAADEHLARGASEGWLLKAKKGRSTFYTAATNAASDGWKEITDAA